MPEPAAADDRRASVRNEPGSGEASTTHWRQCAAFTVFVDAAASEDGHERRQTRLYHDETGDETTLDGFDQTALVRWLVEHLDTTPANSPPSAKTETKPQGRAYLLHVEILAVRVMDRIDTRPDMGEQDIRVEARLRVAGSNQLIAALGAAVIGPLLDMP